MLFAVILLGIAANLDNLCIGMSYGLSGKQIIPSNNLLISGVSGVFAFAACALATLLNQGIARYTRYIGAILLVIIGLYTVIAAFRKKTDVCGENEDDVPQRLSPRETVILGVALAVNSLACSFAAGLSEIPPLPLAGSIAFLSFLFIALGNIIGGRIFELCSGRTLDLLSGFILVITGALQLLF